MDIACCEGRKTRMKVNATVLQRAIRHCARISRRRFTIGFLLNTAFYAKSCARIHIGYALLFVSPVLDTWLLPDISFLPCTRRIFLYAKSQLNFVAAGKARRYEIIERTISSSRVSSSLRKSEYINVKKRVTLSCKFQVLIESVNFNIFKKESSVNFNVLNKDLFVITSQLKIFLRSISYNKIFKCHQLYLKSTV